MVGVVGVIGLLVIVLVNSALAALMTRFFRVRLATSWGSIVYALFLIPLALVVLVPVYSSIFGGFLNFGSNVTLFVVAVALPLALGITFDYFWMPAPDEVELPQRA